MLTLVNSSDFLTTEWDTSTTRNLGPIAAPEEGEIKKHQDANVPVLDTRVEDAETRTNQANTRTEEAEARTDEANIGTSLIEQNAFLSVILVWRLDNWNGPS